MNVKEKIIEYVMRFLERLIDRAEGYKEIDKEYSTIIYLEDQPLVEVFKNQDEILNGEEWIKKHLTYVK